MARDTVRDRVWTYCLTVTHRKGEAVRPEEAAEKASCSETTARDTLNTIAAKGFVERDVLEDGTVRFLPTDTL